jgi:arylsulfatase A-like enzyme
MLVELLLTTVSGRSMYSLEPLDRFLTYFPWQIALFAAMGIAVAMLTRAFSLSSIATGWVAVGLATWTFFGARLGEGIFRRWAAHGGATARTTLALAVAALVIGVILWLLSCLGSLLPRGRRERWPIAAWTGWTLFFLAFMHRAGPEIGGWGGGGPLAWLERLHPAHALLAIVAAALVVVAPSWSKTWLLWVGMVAAVLIAAPVLLSVFDRTDPLTPRDQDGMPDVLVILADALRADHLGLVDGSDSITPALDSVAAESVVFANAFSPSNQTPRAMPGIFTSLPHEMIGTFVRPEVATITQLLNEAGYSTGGLSTNPFVSSNFGYDRGFDRFVDPNDVDEFLVLSILRGLATFFPRLSYGLGISDSALFYRPAASVRRGAVEVLAAMPSPTFIYLHLMDAHGPYLPDKKWLPDEFRLRDFYSYFKFDYLKKEGVLNTESFQPQLENLRQRYRGEVRGMDSQLGRLIEELKRANRWDEMLVWLLADHGEAFGEDDWAGHGGDNLKSSVMRVPFLMKPPRSWQIQPRVETAPVSVLSLLPTTMALIGLPVEPNPFAEDLSSLIYHQGEAPARGAIVSHGGGSYAVIDWPWKLIVTNAQDTTAQRELYDLSQDPMEVENLISQHPEIVSKLEAKLIAWMENVSLGQFASEEIEIDAGTLERLRSLGYIQ